MPTREVDLSSYAFPFRLPDDPSRPVLSALRQACVANWSAFVAIVMEVRSSTTKSTQKPDEAVVVQKMKDALRYLQNTSELLRWLDPNTSDLSVATALQVADLLRKSGCSDKEVQAALKRVGRKGVGRPAIKRHIAIQAKEMRLVDPKRWKWSKIAETLCDCGKDHDIRCQDNLRREVLHLEKVLSKFGCAVNQPWEKHPGVSPMR